jgi:plastocyanin
MQALRRDMSRKAQVALAVALAGAIALLLSLGGHASATPTATASKSVTVSIKNFEYKPDTLRISKGTRVVWVNNDSVKHTATKGGSFTTGKIKPGKAVAVRFTSKGTYAYHCSLHPQMHGKIVVG